MSRIMLNPLMSYTHSSPLSSVYRMPQLTAAASEPISHSHSSQSPQTSLSSGVPRLQNEYGAFETLSAQKDHLSTEEFNLSPSDSTPRLSCANCGRGDSTLWRRDADGNSICNACGESIFYYFQHHDPSSHTCLPVGGGSSSRYHIVLAFQHEYFGVYYVHDFVAVPAWPLL
jgi:hypothetical protein